MNLKINTFFTRTNLLPMQRYLIFQLNTTDQIVSEREMYPGDISKYFGD